MELLHFLWAVLSFVLGLVWQAAWFLLRDLISTALWLLVIGWLILSVRYRSFSAGALALLRYGTFGFRLLWRWLWGKPAAMPAPPRGREIRALELRRRRPFGTMSVSEQLNMLLVGALYLLFFG